jgi:hypothetical protein
LLFESGERGEDIRNLPGHSGGEQSTGANEGVAAPVKKPGVTGDDRFALTASNDKSADSAQQGYNEWIIAGWFWTGGGGIGLGEI